MCTIIAAVGVWPEAPLVIAANRDERLDRPAVGPQLWPAGEVAARKVWAPRDLVAGGTWLGLNDAGLFVGITNRYVARTDGSRRSRGELVFAALGAEDHQHARALILEIEPRDYNAFHLLFADRHGAAIVWSDGFALHEQPLGPGLHWLTERSFGATASGRHDRLAALASTLVTGPLPEPERWRSILADHSPHCGPGEHPQPSTLGLDAMCVHAQPYNYGTRSSTLIELAPKVGPNVGSTLAPKPGASRFLHAPGRPCETAFVELFAGVELE